MSKSNKAIRQFEVLLVEDNEKVARGIKRKLKEKLELSLHGNAKNAFKIIHVKNKAEFDEYVSKNQGDHLSDEFIIDLNLGGAKKEEEGMEILEEILGKGPNNSSSLIIYTGSNSESIKIRCYGLGVEKERFISKGEGTEFDEIENLVNKDFNEYLANLKDFNIHTDTDLAKQAEKNIQKPKDPMVRKNVVFNKTPDVIPIQGLCLSIYSDVIGLYDKLSLGAKVGVCNFFLDTFRIGHNFYGIAGEIFELAADENQYDISLIGDIQYFGQTKVNPKTQCLEGLYWYDKSSKLIGKFDFTDLEDIRQYFEKRHVLQKKFPKFLIHLAELAAAKSLANLFLQGNRKKQEEIVQQATKLGSGMTGMGAIKFISSVWESKQILNKDAKKTCKQLQALTEFGFPSIEEIFYCKITDIDEGEEIVETEIISLEDTRNPFPRVFDKPLLDAAGLVNPDACFKLIICNHAPFSAAYLVEPISVWAYYEKVKRE